MDIAIFLLIWVAPVLLGFVFGRITEQRHYRSIAMREAQLVHLPTTASKTAISNAPVARCELVSGGVVISADYFKRLAAMVRGLVGGPIASYETLLDRARREAVLRLKESCPDAHEIVNLRLETAPISGNAKGGIGSVDVFAYGTALYFEEYVQRR